MPWVRMVAILIFISLGLASIIMASVVEVRVVTLTMNTPIADTLGQQNVAFLMLLVVLLTSLFWEVLTTIWLKRSSVS